MKRFLLISNIFVFALVALILASMVKGNTRKHIEEGTTSETVSSEADYGTIINPDGDTLATRFQTPTGYERVDASDTNHKGFTEFIRNYQLKEDGAPVLLYDESEKSDQSLHAAVFQLPLGNRDLQEATDSVQRIIAEYLYSEGEYSKIKFTLGDNFQADFKTWSKGKGISLEGNNLTWVASSSSNDSYESFEKFMTMVYAYSGIWSLQSDCKEVSVDNLSVGDILMKDGKTGHVIMVVDECVNDAGEKMVLLAEGNSPAQEFHVVKNPAYDDNPWFKVSDIHFPFSVAGYTFSDGYFLRYL